MSDFSKIQWTDHTFSPWWGCARISPACRFCYADDLAKRWGHEVWRRHGPRKMLSDSTWAKPLKWNRDAQRAGTPAKVFCASMADVFEDHPDVKDARLRLWDLIDATPWLCWQLLTKRPENIASMAPWGNDWPAHVWIGTSVENQRYAELRIPILAAVPAKVRFLSCEPLLGDIDLGEHKTAIDWLIIGGESGGAKVRETELTWAEGLIHQARDSGIAPFVKQLGSAWARDWQVGGRSVYAAGDRKGGNPSNWPTDLRIREFPEPAAVTE